LENDKIHNYLSLNFFKCSEIILVCRWSSNSTTRTWYLVMDCDTWLT